jgi:RNA polymerase sigma-70 factor (ECF subfamily)
MRSRDLAWEAVQDSLLALWRARTRPEPLRGWLAQTVIHRCLHMQRSMRRRRHYEEVSVLFQRTHGPDAIREPFSEIEREHLNRQLSEALGSLPDQQRQVLWLREVELLDYRSIAERMRISDGTVRSRLHRARLAARQKLQAAIGRENCALCKADK